MWNCYREMCGTKGKILCLQDLLMWILIWWKLRYSKKLAPTLIVKGKTLRTEVSDMISPNAHLKTKLDERNTSIFFRQKLLLLLLFFSLIINTFISKLCFMFTCVVQNLNLFDELKH